MENQKRTNKAIFGKILGELHIGEPAYIAIPGGGVMRTSPLCHSIESKDKAVLQTSNSEYTVIPQAVRTSGYDLYDLDVRSGRKIYICRYCEAMSSVHPVTCGNCHMPMQNWNCVEGDF